MNATRWLVGLMLGLCLPAYAADEDAQTVTCFRVPEYDEQNNLKSELFGDFAKILPDGVIEITKLKVDLYSDGKIDVTVTAPKCKYDQKNSTADSDSEIRIARENMVVTGVGFTFNSHDQRFQIMKQARVVLKEAQKSMETGVRPDEKP